VASGVRRIEAVTGQAAFAYMLGFQREIDQLKMALGAKSVSQAVEKMVAELEEVKQHLAVFAKEQANALVKRLEAEGRTIGDLQVFAIQLQENEADHVRTAAQQLKNGGQNRAVLLMAASNGKVQLAIGISDELVKANVLHAGKLVKEVAPIVGGGGGGQAEFASAGGSLPEKMKDALNLFIQLVENTLTRTNG
jgi:alanyl-tRNA synthetase